MKVICEGIYFNERSIESDKEPSKELTIEKYDLDRSSGFIIGRFDFATDAKTKLVFEVEMDGVKIFKGGSNLPFDKQTGKFDIPLFKYPNSAKANKVGKHKIKITYGVITNIAESSTETEWDDVEDLQEADVVIILEKKKNLE